MKTFVVSALLLAGAFAALAPSASAVACTLPPLPDQCVGLDSDRCTVWGHGLVEACLVPHRAALDAGVCAGEYRAFGATECAVDLADHGVAFRGCPAGGYQLHRPAQHPACIGLP